MTIHPEVLRVLQTLENQPKLEILKEQQVRR